MSQSEIFFDKVSRKSKPEPTKTAFRIIEASKEFLEKDYCLLDFGCGSGTITNKVAKVVKSIKAIDISSGMLEFAKNQADKNSISNIDYNQVSIFDECFNDKKFDGVVAFNVLHYIDDMPSLMKRINSLLKPNGVFISSTACLKERRSIIGYVVMFLGKLGLMPKINFYTKNELETLMTNGDFKMIKSDQISKLPEYFIVVKK